MTQTNSLTLAPAMIIICLVILSMVAHCTLIPLFILVHYDIIELKECN